jgi:hypothetical protein
MAKILCTCGQIIIDQSDSIRNKGYIIADQDYMDFFDEVENNGFMEGQVKQQNILIEFISVINVIAL